MISSLSMSLVAAAPQPKPKLKDADEPVTPFLIGSTECAN